MRCVAGGWLKEYVPARPCREGDVVGKRTQPNCVEDMSPEPTASIPAFVSNIPILKGLGLGMISKNAEYPCPIFVDTKT